MAKEGDTVKGLLLLTKVRDTLMSGHKELKANLDELQRKCNSMTDNLGVIQAKCDDLQRDRDKLTGMNLNEASPRPR